MKESSKRILDECSNELVKIFTELDKQGFEFVVICGYRGEKIQNECYAKGLSKCKFPESRHNRFPALAVDVAPLVKGKIPWSDLNAFAGFALQVKRVAKDLNIDIQWGGDWPKFKDYPHYQLKDFPILSGA